MRLFVALPVPDSFASVVEKLPQSDLRGHWIAPGDYHMTIRFLGDVSPERLDQIDSALKRVRRPPFSMEIDGLDVFEGRNDSVLFARVASTRKATALCGDVTDALTPLGFDFGAKPFVPHITLARCDRSENAAKFVKRHGEKVRDQWQVHTFHLMESAEPHTGTNGHYAIRKNYALEGLG